MCILYSWCTKCNSKWLLECDCNHAKKNLAHGKITENRISFEILSAVRMPWRVEAMVNLSVLMAVVFLRWFRLWVVPLLLSPLCVTHNLEEKISCEHFFSLKVYLQSCSTKWKRESNTPSLMAILCFAKQKRFVGRGHLKSPSLLCFMIQLRGEQGLRKWKKKQNKKTKKTKKTQQQIGQNK